MVLSDSHDLEFEPEELPQDPDIGDINAVSADDPVGLYFRQMAQEPLLTAHEEIELAKRIEIGKEARNRLQCPDVTEIYNDRSEEHTSELQSRENIVCRLLLPPSVLYTLSLHDALPISRPRYWRHQRRFR